MVRQRALAGLWATAWLLTGVAVSEAAPQVVSTSSSAGGVTTTVTQSQGTDDTTPKFGTGAISGVVTDGSSGAPLAGVFVQLSGGGGPAASRPGQMTDARGRFVFTHLPASADFSIAAARPGYISGGYKRTPGVPAAVRIALRDAEWMQTADVQLWKPAAISGTVRDELGDPVVGVPVRAVLESTVAGRRRIIAGPATVTDDRGMYRLANLDPGDYLIHVPNIQITLPAVREPHRATPAAPPPASAAASATSAIPDVPAVIRTDGDRGLVAGHFATPTPGSGARAYAMAYHPAALSIADASAVTISFGDQREHVDVQLALVPTVTVSGQVSGSGDAIALLPIRLVPVGSEALAVGAETAFTQTDALGGFTLLNVPAGEYTLLASRTMSEYRRSGAMSSDVAMPRGALMVTSSSMGQVPGADNVSYTTRSSAGAAVSGRLAVSVGDRDVTGLHVPVIEGVKISGTFRWDGVETTPETIQLHPPVRLEPADGDLSLGVRSRMTFRQLDQALPSPLPFEVDGILPGRYLIGQMQSGAYQLEAIEWNGRDLLTQPFEVDGTRDITGIVIRMTSKKIEVTGPVTDADGGTATSGAVLAFPADPALWKDFGLSATMFRTGTIVGGGTYRIDRLVPGDYLLVAVTDADRRHWLDADFLASVAPQATRIKVESGSTISQSLRIVTVRR